MPRISLNVDEKTYKKLKTYAKADKCCVSAWLRSRISAAFSWPPGYFTKTFGSLAGTDFERPPQGRFEDDVRRASFDDK